MSIRRYLATSDNTISTAFKTNLSDRAVAANMGASDILEIFSIYGQASSASLEQSRVLVNFPIDKISQDRQSGIIPSSGSATFKLKLFNAEHGQSVPSGFTLTTSPIVRDWNEGSGLDMESYLDKGASNWYSASSGNSWFTFGGDYLTSSVVQSSPVPYEYTQNFDSGLEDGDVDITPIVEEWIKYHQGNNVNASASITLASNLDIDQYIQFYTYDFQKHTVLMASASVNVGSTYYVVTGSTIDETLGNIKAALDSNISLKITTAGPAASSLTLTQNAGGFYGNTITSASFDDTIGTVTNFNGGTGASNYGLLVRLSGSYESGLGDKSYYTKKFFARSSHHFLERPVIEVQWDSSIKDDRSNVYRSSSLASASDNMNNIYLYNKRKTGYMDIPNTGSNLVVKFVPGMGKSAVSITGDNTSAIYATASKHSTGIYKASFAYEGDESTLYDVWVRDVYTSASSAGVAASASISFASIPLAGETFTLTDTTSATASFFVSGGVETNDGSQNDSGDFIVGRAALEDTAAFVNRLSEVITAQTAVGITSTPDDVTLNLVQDVTGAIGNTTIDLSGFSGASLSTGTGFQGGFTFVPAFNTYTELYTGSAISVKDDLSYSHYDVDNYLVNITNLKSSYDPSEVGTFRLYTRNKNWKPNLYTVATQDAPVDTIREAYYKVARVSDKKVIIDYSTSSATPYSALSYDSKGSYFDLDMSILEPNYLYEISFLRKDGNDYVEQKEKFKFRVNPVDH